MTSDDFKSFLKQKLREIEAKEELKRGEYSTTGVIALSRFEHFHKGASLEGIPVHQVLRGMMAKHTLSIYDMLAKADINAFPESLWEEKIIDNVIYLLLLLGIIREAKEPAQLDTFTFFPKDGAQC